MTISYNTAHIFEYYRNVYTNAHVQVSALSTFGSAYLNP